MKLNDQITEANRHVYTSVSSYRIGRAGINRTDHRDRAREGGAHGYQKVGAFALLKAHGILEQQLKPLGYSVTWKEFSGCGVA